MRSSHEFHREEDLVALGDDELVQVHEVRVVHVGQRAKLLLEEVERRRIEARQRLESDELAAFAVERFVDDAHSALAEAPPYFVSGRTLPVRLANRPASHPRARVPPPD